MNFPKDFQSLPSQQIFKKQFNTHKTTKNSKLQCFGKPEPNTHTEAIKVEGTQRQPGPRQHGGHKSRAYPEAASPSTIQRL